MMLWYFKLYPKTYLLYIDVQNYLITPLDTCIYAENTITITKQIGWKLIEKFQEYD